MKSSTRIQLPAAISLVIITGLVILGVFGGLYFFNRTAKLGENGNSGNADATAPQAEIVIVHAGQMSQVKAFDLGIQLPEYQSNADGTFSSRVIVSRLSDKTVLGDLIFTEVGKPQTLESYTIRVLHITERSVQFAIQSSEPT